MKRLVLPLFLGVAIASPLFAQSVPPALMVKVEEKSEPLRMSKIDTNVRIVGYVAETVTTMTFSNPHDRVLQGDLYFPLPEGATISGYALDINGKLIDGVAVEKDKGREVFEKIVRQNVDPGLVEWTKGNNFKTRVFPIPAKGSRTIRVEYVTELAGEPADPAYQLPLNYSRPIDEFSLRIEVVKRTVAPRVAQGGLPNFEFEKWRESFVAETKLNDVTPSEDLLVAIPNLDKQPVVVERTAAGDYFFAIHDLPSVPQAQPPSRMPQHIVLFWDASGSRQGKHEREIGLLKQYFAAHWPGGGSAAPLQIDLVLLRNQLGEPKRFACTGGDFSKLLDELEGIDYDGGTQLGALAPLADVPTPDLYLLVSDGLSNFGEEEPGELDAPLYVISADVSANHALLRRLATSTGGRLFNLNRLTDEQVVRGIGQTAYSFLSADSGGSQATDLYPRMPEPLAGRFTLVGRLSGDAATVTVNYGYPGRPAGSRSFQVARSGAVEGSLLERMWAQKRLSELLLLPDGNRDEILALGRQFGMVTPFTSLIVLDSLEQYVEHEIAPPKSLPEMRDEYNRRIDTVEHQRSKQKADKLAAVLAMWKSRQQWYDTKFTYPKNFRYKADKDKADTGDEPEAPAEEAPAATGGRRPMRALGGNAAPSGAERDDAAPDAPAPATAPAPMAPRSAAPDRNGESANDPFGGENSLGERVAGEADKKAEGRDAGRQPGIAIKQWDPKTPYLKELNAAQRADAFAVYLNSRGKYGDSPAFYLDCADFFRTQGDGQLSLQVLSNVAELELENAQLLRVLGHRLTQLGYLDLAALTFEDVLALRPEEPQSYRDLALVLGRRADANRKVLMTARMTEPARRELEGQVRRDYGRAIELLNQTVLGHWDGRFEEIELIALVELNRILPLARAAGITEFDVDKRLVKLLEFDVRIIMTWHADNTDIDMWVIEPSGEKAFYSHNRTTIGGLVSRDFTGGYGPEEYLVRRAMNGTYQIKANYYGSRETRLLGEVTVQVDVFTNFGRDNEQHQAITVRLKEAKETVDIGQIEF